MPSPTRTGNVRAQTGMGWDSLTTGDAEALKEIEGVAVVAPTQRARTQVIAGGLNWNPQVEGVTPDYLIARDWTIASGRMFDESEERQARRVVVLGATVANELFPNFDPVGETVRMNGGTFEVIGVLKPKANRALAPIRTISCLRL
ncbi:MAG: ABC transporter permease [Terricaulis sp.]|nr:ABC transporter permease [Terricaulis sp.]